MSEKYINLYKKNENEENGGSFPIGESNTWHSGIHLFNSSVKPLLNGNIVAYRQKKSFDEVKKQKEISEDEFNNLTKEEQNLYRKIRSDESKEKAAVNKYILEDEETKEKISGNFYLIKHSFLHDKLTFYTLYNHLIPDDIQLENLKKYTDNITDLINTELPLTKRLIFKFIGSKEMRSDFSLKKSKKIFPGSWFVSECDILLSEFEKTTQDLLCKFDTELEKQVIACKDVDIHYVDIEFNNVNLYKKESDVLYSIKEPEYSIGKCSKLLEDIKKDKIEEIISQRLAGTAFTPNHEYLNRMLLLPLNCFENILYDEKNIYSLRYTDSEENIYRVSSNKTSSDFDITKCPLEFEEFKYSPNKSRILQEKIIILTWSELCDILQQSGEKYYPVFDKSNIIISIVKSDPYLINENLNYKIDANILPQKKANEMYIQNIKKPKIVSIRAQKSESFAFIYLNGWNQDNCIDTKIFVDGHIISPIKLPETCYLALSDFTKKYNSKKIKNPDYLNMNQVCILLTHPIKIYKDDAFRENLQIYKNYHYSKIKENGGYIICNPYIQDKYKRNYITRASEIYVKKIKGRAKNNLDSAHDDNFVLYSDLNEINEYGSKNPLEIRTTETEFSCNSKPIEKGDYLYFSDIDIDDSKVYSSIINKKALQVKVENTDKIINANGEIHFCNIPITENDLLGYSFLENRNKDDKKYYDVSLFLEKNYMKKENQISDMDNKYYIYKTIKKNKILFENKLNKEIIFFPKNTDLSFIEKKTINNRIAYKLKIKKIPIFLDNKNVETVEGKVKYFFRKNPIEVYLDDRRVGLDRANTHYCYNLLSEKKIYKKYLRKELEYLYDDPVNSNQFKAYYFSAKDLNLDNEYWIFEKDLNSFVENVSENGEFEVTGNIENLYCYLTDPLKHPKDILEFKIFYIPVKTIIKCNKIVEHEDKRVFKIIFNKIPITIHNKYIQQASVYKIKKDADIQNIYLNNTSVTKESKGDNEKFANGFFNIENITQLKNTELEFYKEGTPNTYIGLYIPADKINMNFDFWIKQEDFEQLNNYDKDTFIVEKESSLKIFYNNPLVLHAKDYILQKDVQVENINDDSVFQDENKKKYYKIELEGQQEELYIPVKEADNYRDDALDWKKHFKICNTDSDKDIFCNLEDIKECLGLSDSEKETVGDLSTIKMQDLFKNNRESIIEKIHSLNVTHIHELDSKAYANLNDEIKKSYLQECCGKIGVWQKLHEEKDFNTSELKNVDCKDNLLTFVHPAYFLNHLDKSKMFEFNPYKKYKYLSPRHPDTVIKAEYVAHHNSKIEVLSNPGFAPASSSNSDSKRFPYEYNGLYYGAVNWCYYCSIYPHVTKSGKPHTGIDFAGYEGTPIYSFIQGEVWATSFMGNMINGASNGGKSYGRMMLIKGNNNRLYLLGHLSAYNKKKGDPVKPGDIVAYVGNTGASEGAHLHVEVFECENTISKDKVININASENIEMRWRNGNEWKHTKKRKNPFNH